MKLVPEMAAAESAAKARDARPAKEKLRSARLTVAPQGFARNQGDPHHL